MNELTTAYDALPGDVVSQKLDAMRQEERDKMKLYQRQSPLSQALIWGHEDTVDHREFPDAKVPMKSAVQVTLARMTRGCDSFVRGQPRGSPVVIHPFFLWVYHPSQHPSQGTH